MVELSLPDSLAVLEAKLANGNRFDFHPERILS